MGVSETISEIFPEISLGMVRLYTKWGIFMEHVCRENIFALKQLIHP